MYHLNRVVFLCLKGGVALSDIVEAYRKRRQARLDAKKAEQRKTIEAYYARRDARIKARQNAESGANKAIAGKNTLLSGRKNVIISKRNTDADDRIRDDLGRFARNPGGGSDIGGQRNAHSRHGKKSGGGGGGSTKGNKSNKPNSPKNKPTAINKKLQNSVNNLYKHFGSKGKVGNGTTMDMLEDERRRGITNGTHAKKARDELRALKSLRGEKLAESDKELVRTLRGLIKDSFKTPVGGGSNAKRR